MAVPGIRKTSVITEHHFDSRETASIAAATCIAGLLKDKLAIVENTMLVVSGGTTPGQCFSALSGVSLDWRKICVALSDERWVANDHEDSNERLIRETLLTNAAGDASVLPVFRAGLSAEERCDELQSYRPNDGFACALVGMGGDGHFASLFPDADDLEAGLALDNTQLYIPIHTAASPHPRISMTLAALLRSERILLLFFGDDKYEVYEQAKAGSTELPVSHLLRQDIADVNVYWAP